MQTPLSIPTFEQISACPNLGAAPSRFWASKSWARYCISTGAISRPGAAVVARSLTDCKRRQV
eukprot:5817479-Pleurochrysis_carterae.AAC.1